MGGIYVKTRKGIHRIKPATTTSKDVQTWYPPQRGMIGQWV